MPRSKFFLRPTVVFLWVLLAGQMAADELNRVVLRVNDEIFTLHDYEKRKNDLLQALMSDPSISPALRQERLARIGKQAMQDIYRDLLLESQARRIGLSVMDREVDEGIAEIMKTQGIPDQETLVQALASARLTLEQLRKNVRQEILISRLIQKEVTGKMEIPEEDLRTYYRTNPDEFRIPEERKLREVIVLDSSGLAEVELAKKANELRSALASGKDAAEAVGNYQDQALSTGWIDLGWLKRAELEKSLGDAAWALEVGAYSEPVRGRGGIHVVQLEEKRGGELQPFSDVEKRIEARERQKRFGKEFRSFLARLEKSSYIKEDLPPEAIGFRALAGEFKLEDELEQFRAPLPAEAGEQPPAPKPVEPAPEKKDG
jgi:parvulin-like peptidyl-prolyl isomerase